MDVQQQYLSTAFQVLYEFGNEEEADNFDDIIERAFPGSGTWGNLEKSQDGKQLARFALCTPMRVRVHAVWKKLRWKKAGATGSVFDCVHSDHMSVPIQVDQHLEVRRDSLKLQMIGDNIGGIVSGLTEEPFSLAADPLKFAEDEQHK
ncbi:hypothetical protein MCOR21_011123 [Pyricularia oryzae]|nr:hypothetical protein MCOR21_011123 [Pyricularia oryzae]